MRDMQVGHSTSRPAPGTRWQSISGGDRGDNGSRSRISCHRRYGTGTNNNNNSRSDKKKKYEQ